MARFDHTEGLDVDKEGSGAAEVIILSTGE